MKTVTYRLTEDDLKEQRDAAEFYKKLILKELSFNDLANLDNIQKYSKAFKRHSELAARKNVEIKVPF